MITGGVAIAAANTWDVVDWPKLKVKLSAAPLPLSPRGHAALLVDIANGRKVTIGRLSQLVGLETMNGGDTLEVPFAEKARADLRQMLTIIADGTSQQRTEIERWSGELSSKNVLISPSWSPEHGRRERVIASNMNAAIVYGFWLLSDRRGELEGTLCRCHYSKCGKFFFKRRAKGGLGAPARRYCSTKHGQLANREQSKERMRRSRRG